MDGEVVIKATLDSSELEKQLKQQKSRLIQYEKEEERLIKQRTKLEETSLKSYFESQKMLYEEMQNNIKNAKEDLEKKAAQKGYEKTMAWLGKSNAAQLKQYEQINQRIKETQRSQSLLKNEIGETTGKLNQSKLFDGIKGSINDIGKSISKITKKVVRWGLAIFSIRGAYMAIRRAVSVISEQDEQLGANIEYMRNALAYALEPIVRRIVEWLKQMMYYVGYLTKAWFGRNIFENANKSLKSASKSAKELKKQLAGFDEMNVLSSDSSAGGGTPDFDLTKPEDMPIPGWLDWLAKNGDTVKLIVEAIGIGIASWKLANLIKDLGLLGSLPIWKLVAGIALTIAGLVIYIKKMIDYFKDPTWENFIGILGGLALVAAGVFLIFGGFPALIVTIIGLVGALVAAIVKNWDKIKGFFKKIITWINDKFIQPIKDKFNALPNWAKRLITGIANVIITALNVIIEALNIFLLPFRAIIVGLGKVLGKDWNFETIRVKQIPLMAKGAIINQPGRGVPVGGGIGGERGMEGVLPLTDSQQMALLGESIGKYVNISATIPVYVGNRQIAREIRKINAEDDFAYNR